jgi:protein phosphatase
VRAGAEATARARHPVLNSLHVTTTPIPPGRPTDPRPTGEVVVHVFGKTDVGRTREHNEDAFIVADLTTNNATLQPEVRTHKVGGRGTLFMVADGMGGAAAGEIASAMAVDVVMREITERWLQDERCDPETFANALRLATAAANAQINAFAAEHPEYHGMGTTATIAGLLDDTLYLAQVGDSRAYLIREGTAVQLTKDQSLLQKLIEAGELTEEEAAQSERRNIILQALGPEPQIKVDLTHQTVRRGDTLVLCSDGLSGQVRTDEIAQVVSAHDDLVGCCRTLIEMANGRGGPDNITVIVARFEGAGLQAASAADEVGHRVFRLPGSEPTPITPIQAVPAAVMPPRDAGPAFADAASDGRPALHELPEPIDTMAAPPPPPTTVIPPVPPGRRGRGMAIATALLLVLLAGAAFMVYRTAKRIIPPAATPDTTSVR